jgi:hypothetical protein
MKAHILINTKTDSYIGIDRASGGYPYDTDHLGSAKIWYNKKDAKEYADIFPDEKLTLHEVVVVEKPCAWD